MKPALPDHIKPDMIRSLIIQRQLLNLSQSNEYATLSADPMVLAFSQVVPDDPTVYGWFPLKNR